MEEKSQTEVTAVEPTAKPEEKKSLGKKILDVVTGKKEDPATNQVEDEPTAEDKKDEAAGESVITEEKLQEALEKAKAEAIAEYQRNQEEQARKASLTPEELKAEEDAQKDKELESLKHDILVRDCKDKAITELSSDGYPVELAGILDYTNEQTANESLKTVKKIFADCLEQGIKERLKGKTPNGLNASSDINDLEDRKAKLRSSMGIKKK